MVLYRIKYVFIVSILALALPWHAGAEAGKAAAKAEHAHSNISLFEDNSNGLLVISREAAEMLKLDPTSSCSDLLIVHSPTEVDDSCRQEGDKPFDVIGVEVDDPHVLISLGHDSYELGGRGLRYIEKNQRVMIERIPERFKRYLSRSGKYLRMMKNILREEGVPEDIAYLPLIESGFYPYAYSRSRASGLWQFIRATGRRYGLKINWWVDERRDPVKSTHAAARYLKDLHKMFGSWSLALAGYNAGEGKIRRALKKTKAKDFWSIMRTMKIKPETRNYVPKFIAARRIAMDPEAYGFTNIEYQDDFIYDEVTLEFPLSLDVIAKSSGTTVKIIKDLNPELRRWSTPPVDTYKLRVPRGTRDLFLANLPKIPAAQRVTVKVHIVRSGDTVSEISHRYSVPQRAIISYNRLGRKALIRPGQRLIIPINHKTSKR
jgi:membrane-bound lytic murein transglycosylase D